MLPFRLLFPAAPPCAEREALVRRMAAVVAAHGAFSSERDTIRLLMAKGFRALDVALLADDVRQVAMQSVVAREMSRP